MNFRSLGTPYLRENGPPSDKRPQVGTFRWDVPARVPAGGTATSTEQRDILEPTTALIAPLNAARTVPRTVLILILT